MSDILVSPLTHPALKWGNPAYAPVRAASPFHPFLADFGGQFPPQPAFRGPAETAAQKFYKATLGMQFGCDVATIQKTLETVHAQGLKKPFSAEVVRLAQQDGYGFKSAVEILDHKFGGPLACVKQVPRKECRDYWHHGKNLYRPTAMEYRIRGMWTTIANFLTVCKRHPVVSTAVIGAVAYFGGTYPFLGATSGIAIMAWTSVFAIKNELAARKIPGMDADKAKHYTESGENIIDFLLTFSGVDGIYAGAKNGARVFTATAAQDKNASMFYKLGLKTWGAVKSTLQQGQTLGLRFLIGQFDNVLLPFNAVADKMQKNEH